MIPGTAKHGTDLDATLNSNPILTQEEIDKTMRSFDNASPFLKRLRTAFTETVTKESAPQIVWQYGAVMYAALDNHVGQSDSRDVEFAVACSVLGAEDALIHFNDGFKRAMQDDQDKFFRYLSRAKSINIADTDPMPTDIMNGATACACALSLGAELERIGKTDLPKNFHILEFASFASLRMAGLAADVLTRLEFIDSMLVGMKAYSNGKYRSTLLSTIAGAGGC